MTGELYACAYAAEFPAQALLRLRADLARQPVAVVEGPPPQQTICSCNRRAQRIGAAAGMTRLEAEAIPGLRLLARCAETEAAARAVFLECAAQFSPRIQNAAMDTDARDPAMGANHHANHGAGCAFVLDIAGTERLFGPPQQLAERLRAALAQAGFRVSVAVSANDRTARIKAAAGRGVTVIPAGEEARTLANLPLSALNLAAEAGETFALWGIRTLGELAALPETDLVTRLGPHAAHWRALARGAAEHLFQPLEPAFRLEEFCAFETPVEQLDSLLFMAARMIDCLVVRAASRALLPAQITVRMKLENGTLHERTIRPALPTADRKFLLKLLQLEIAAHPPPAAVLALTLTGEAGAAGAVQLGLFAPQTPEPSRLDVTLARLKALVGDGRVGSPVLEDTHQAGSFRIEDFSVSPAFRRSVASPASPGKGREATVPVESQAVPRMALRRVRPPTPVRVMLHAGKPAAFRDAENSFQVAAAYGPWRSSGSWWASGTWDTEEWDVLATQSGGASMACVLTRNCALHAWRLEAFYD